MLGKDLIYTYCGVCGCQLALSFSVFSGFLRRHEKAETFQMKKCDARSNNSNGRYRGPPECNSGFDHGILCGINQRRVFPRNFAAMQSAIIIIQESWSVECRCLALQAVKYSKRYAGCRQRACTVPERLVGMGKSEWGLGMLHQKAGVCAPFPRIQIRRRRMICY